MKIFKEFELKIMQIIDKLNRNMFKIYSGSAYLTLEIDQDQREYDYSGNYIYIWEYKIKFCGKKIFSISIDSNSDYEFFEVSEEKVKNKVIEFFKAQIEENSKIIEALNSNEIDEILNAKNVQESIEKNAK